jgi:hypothetical protein
MHSPLKPEMNGQSLSPKPKLGEAKVERPEIMSIETKLKFNRPTVEATFQRAKFEDRDFDKDGKVIVTEICRPAKEGEKAVFYHVITGMNFVVDHYECDGVIL